MNPFDSLIHALSAPGRYLSEALEVSGAVCHPTTWRQGRRLATSLQARRGLLCRRIDLDEVVIEARTKHGACRIEIPAGDPTPRCWDYFGTTSKVLERPPPEPCLSRAINPTVQPSDPELP